MEKTSPSPSPLQSTMFLLKSGDPVKHLNLRSTIESLRERLGLERAYIVPHGPGVDLLVILGNTRVDVSVALRELQKNAELQGGMVCVTDVDELSIPFNVPKVEAARVKLRVIELKNEEALLELRFSVSSYLIDAGFTEKMLDKQGAAFYRGEEPPRGEEPVIVEHFLMHEKINMVQMKIVLRMGKSSSEEAADVLKKRIPKLVDVARFNPVVEDSASGRVYVFNFIAPREIITAA